MKWYVVIDLTQTARPLYVDKVNNRSIVLSGKFDEPCKAVEAASCKLLIHPERLQALHGQLTHINGRTTGVVYSTATIFDLTYNNKPLLHEVPVPIINEYKRKCLETGHYQRNGFKMIPKR